MGPSSTDDIFMRFFEEIDCGGLDLVPFWIKPHMNSSYFPGRSKQELIEKFEGVPVDTYFLDDESAVVVDGKEIRVVSGGDWHKAEGIGNI